MNTRTTEGEEQRIFQSYSAYHPSEKTAEQRRQELRSHFNQERQSIHDVQPYSPRPNDPVLPGDQPFRSSFGQKYMQGLEKQKSRSKSRESITQ